jgi:hypothetical protein
MISQNRLMQERLLMQFSGSRSLTHQLSVTLGGNNRQMQQSQADRRMLIMKSNPDPLLAPNCTVTYRCCKLGDLLLCTSISSLYK